MKKVLMLIVMVVATVTMYAQSGASTELTNGGLTLVKSATTNYTVPVGKMGFPFTYQWFSNLSVNDTTQLKVYQSMTSSGPWEQLGSTQTDVASDTTDIVSDTTWTKYLKFSVIAGNNDSTGKIKIYLYWNK